ncbi:hypothetical protein QJS04_geneDACA008533 [Acorus gramineus]|uniref:Water stress and hypersensitive response domain-containing protein n=1 Tax=Acorus gramineus TaxID=55184 RepID=A0AAV9AFM0_ACOGR|nr:hypothetical protein QJS04_geneDACA008533 [Acorus gramineus]
MIGAATATAATTLLLSKPKDPTFHLISISLSSFHLSLPARLDLDLLLTVHVTNPNPLPISYIPTTLSISYRGSPLASATVCAGSQPPQSCQILHLPARLHGVDLAHHAIDFLSDAAKREVVFEASVNIEGSAGLLWWSHRFCVHVNSHVVIDPVFLSVVEQENRSEMEVSMLPDLAGEF